MSAARALSICGHKVTLLEKTDSLGGQLNLACVSPHKQEVSKWTIYLKNELKRLCVDVKYNILATKQIIDEYSPDVVVVSTGSNEIIPPVEGVDRENAITSHKVLKNEEVILGGNVLVVGGGMVGCEVCEHLMHNKRGHMSITMVEMLDSVGADMPPNNLVPMMKRFEELKINIMPSTKLLSVNGANAEVEFRGKKIQLNGFTHIIYACGCSSENSLYNEIKDKYENVICIGDASSPGQALQAVKDGYEIAVNLK